jgi:peptidoglycan/xylan/chitin deacetylase (PgdA/CDA1 family)
MSRNPDMRLVSPFLKRAVYPTLHRAGMLHRIMPPGGYAVVNYHGVIPAGYADNEKFLDGNLLQPSVLRQQLRFLKSRYHVLHPEEFRSCVEQGQPMPPRSVLVTCDDGLLNTLTDMLPVLQDEGVVCLFFMTAASCEDDPGMLWYEELYRLMRDQPFNVDLNLPSGAENPPANSNFQARWWNAVQRISQLSAEARTKWMTTIRLQCEPLHTNLPTNNEKRWRLLNVRELKQLVDAGMCIGAHTRTHPVLSFSSDEEARREIEECRAEIGKTLGLPVWAFAYPYGNPATLGDREFRLAQQAGYSCAFLNVEHWSGQESNHFAIPRTHVTADMTLPEFSAHLSGFHTRLQRAAGL